MKPNKPEYIPFWGCKKYFRRYFKKESTTLADVKFALKFQQYHMVTESIIILLAIKLLTILLN